MTEAMREQFDPSEALMRAQQACAQADKLAYDKGYQAALRSPAVAGLVEACRKLIEDSQFMREEYSDMNKAVEQARAALAQYATLAGESHG